MGNHQRGCGDNCAQSPVAHVMVVTTPESKQWFPRWAQAAPEAAKGSQECGAEVGSQRSDLVSPHLQVTG